jgi:hypothetical protein
MACLLIFIYYKELNLIITEVIIILNLTALIYSILEIKW